ncbi:hypothetical protein CEXT_276621 [Caerostris extrusa]|uniref:Uncharacterized protein n=1 Tax=Caerostris extrusa TaxID=172846 RepID=A0AAV4XDC0_CAEEX|nr:hypothetical protein CEXT_276621 [Caerostris extrusa]
MKYPQQGSRSKFSDLLQYALKLVDIYPQKFFCEESSSGFSVEIFGFTPIRLEIGGHLPPKISSVKNPHQTFGWKFSELLQ